jgi:hypothetical protein
MLQRRQRFTSIYNVNADTLRDVLPAVLDGLQLRWTRTGDFVSIEAKDGDREKRILIEVDAFPLLRHVSLRWAANSPGVRQAIEAELARSLSQVQTADNPTGAWFLAVAAALFSATFFGMILFFVGLIVRILDR